MHQSTVRSAGLALLLTMGGCGEFTPSGTGARTPGLNVAEAALQGGAAQIALQVSDGVLSESPHNTRAMEIKGDALSLMGDYDGAAAIYQALLAKDPNSSRANIGLGRVKLAKDPAGAEALFQLVLKRDPKELTALNNLGIARDLQGRHAEAQPAYRQALAIDPNLESAQVNLALSMAMTGRGPEAILLLKAKATQPGAPVKVKHDYAAVLAMAGNRAEAERVLGDDMAPDEIHQLLDSVTGTHTRLVRDAAPASGGGTFASRQADSDYPPDVVQVPEPAVTSRMAARASAPTVAMAAALATPPPMIVRPRPVADPDADTPAMQPVSPVAAAVTNQRPLALPMRSAPPESAPQPVEAAQVVTPEVVPLPPTRPAQRLASAGNTQMTPLAKAAPAAQAEAPPPPALHQAPQPRADIAPAHASIESPPAVVARTDAAPVARQDGSSQTVQFAAVASEESAHAFWNVLVHRFPDTLGQREPVVIRFERGGTVFWRVRTEGFGTVTEAQSLCARMRAGGQDCFVPRS